MRVLTRLVAGTIAAALTAAGVIALIEIVHAAGGPGYAHANWPGAVSALVRNTWSDTGPRVLGGILVGLGALCLGLGLRRDRTVGAPLVAPDPTDGWFTSRRSLRRSLRSVALATPTVAKAQVRGRRGRIRVRAVLIDDPGSAERDLSDRLRRRLDGFQPARPPALKIRFVHRGAPPVTPDDRAHGDRPTRDVPTRDAPTGDAPTGVFSASGGGAGEDRR